MASCACDVEYLEKRAAAAGRPLTECERAIVSLVKGRMIGRTDGGCQINTPGVWDDCVPRNVQWGVRGDAAGGFAGVDMAAASREADAVQVSFVNGTDSPIALLDLVVDQAVSRPPAAAATDVGDDLVLDQIIGAETGGVSYGTFAGEESTVLQAGAEVGQIGNLADGIRLAALNAERAASFGASSNYGSILSKFILPVIMPNQRLRARMLLALGAPDTTNIYLSGQMLMVKIPTDAWEKIKAGKMDVG